MLRVILHLTMQLPFEQAFFIFFPQKECEKKRKCLVNKWEISVWTCCSERSIETQLNYTCWPNVMLVGGLIMVLNSWIVYVFLFFYLYGPIIKVSIMRLCSFGVCILADNNVKHWLSIISKVWKWCSWCNNCFEFLKTTENTAKSIIYTFQKNHVKSIVHCVSGFRF